jgi:hypothetical protein
MFVGRHAYLALPLAALNSHFARLGYQMAPRDPFSPDYDYFIQWTKPGADPITLAAPQFQAAGYDQLVYDLYDIRDLLKHLGRPELETIGHELRAARRTAS